MKIETISGKLVDPLDPKPEDFCIEDIAWSLSRISRFAGHTISKIPYTVGQHCIFVSTMIEDMIPNSDCILYGLLHDASECYIGDIPSPVKHLPQIKEQIDVIEDNIFRAILEHYDIAYPSSSEWRTVKQFDKRAQLIEAFNYMPSRGLNWSGRDEHVIDFIDLQDFPKPMEAIEVYKQYKERFTSLMSKRKYNYGY